MKNVFKKVGSVIFGIAVGILLFLFRDFIEDLCDNRARTDRIKDNNERARSRIDRASSYNKSVEKRQHAIENGLGKLDESVGRSKKRIKRANEILEEIQQRE